MKRDSVGLATAEAYRIGIIGGGPRGLYCLERLCLELDRLPSGPPISVIVFESSGQLGAGTVYGKGQPAYLRMNFANRHIDAWSGQSRRRFPSERSSLVDWLRTKHPALANEHLNIPRAVVGEYLCACFEEVVARRPDCVEVSVVATKAEGLWREGGGWATSAGGRVYYFHEVLVAVGHEGWRASTPLNPGGKASDRVVDCVYPVEQKLSQDAVEPGARVAVRGFALTWIDACLALTEGRGGRFTRETDGWRYRRVGSEPSVIAPFSRSGRPMLAKPDSTAMHLPDGLDEVWMRGLAKMRALPLPQGGIDFAGSLWPTVLAAAEEACRVVDAAPGEDARNWFERWHAETSEGSLAFSRMRQSFKVATGLILPDMGWALGEAWRRLYPALVEQVSHGRLAQSSWTEFRRVAAEMERIAFGPPAENLGRMLALAEAELLDLSWLRSDFSISEGKRMRLSVQERDLEIDVLVNASIAAPQEPASDGIIESLLQAGYLRRAKGSGGIEVDFAARPIDRVGKATQRLAVIGRATEGWALGNDTLARSLHRYPEEWARSVARNLQVKRNGEGFDVNRRESVTMS